MKKIINTFLFVTLLCGPIRLAFADETPAAAVSPAASESAAPVAAVTVPAPNDNDKKNQEEEERKKKAEEEALKRKAEEEAAALKKQTEEEAQKKAEEAANAQKAMEAKVASEKQVIREEKPVSSTASFSSSIQKPQEPTPASFGSSQREAVKPSVGSVTRDVPEENSARIKHHYYARPQQEDIQRGRVHVIRNRSAHDAPQATVTYPSAPAIPTSTPTAPSKPSFASEQSPVPAEPRKRSSFIDSVREATREANKPDVVVVKPKPNVVVVENKGGFISHVRSATENAQNGVVVSVQRDVDDERRFRERELRERELRLREWQIREREERLNNDEYRLSQRERAIWDRDWYNRQLRKREWENIEARDRELRYLLWRERFLSQYFWKEPGRVCHYVTTYRTGVKKNIRTTVCEWRNGVYTCYHPKRYFIFPMTKVVCYPRNDSRLIGTVVREYPY